MPCRRPRGRHAKQKQTRQTANQSPPSLCLPIRNPCYKDRSDKTPCEREVSVLAPSFGTAEAV